jgi:hypothetical protein
VAPRRRGRTRCSAPRPGTARSRVPRLGRRPPGRIRWWAPRDSGRWEPRAGLRRPGTRHCQSPPTARKRRCRAAARLLRPLKRRRWHRLRGSPHWRHPERVDPRPPPRACGLCDRSPRRHRAQRAAPRRCADGGDRSPSSSRTPCTGCRQASRPGQSLMRRTVAAGPPIERAAPAPDRVPTVPTRRAYAATRSPDGPRVELSTCPQGCPQACPGRQLPSLPRVLWSPVPRRGRVHVSPP